MGNNKYETKTMWEQDHPNEKSEHDQIARESVEALFKQVPDESLREIILRRSIISPFTTNESNK